MGSRAITSHHPSPTQPVFSSRVDQWILKFDLCKYHEPQGLVQKKAGPLPADHQTTRGGRLSFSSHDLLEKPANQKNNATKTHSETTEQYPFFVQDIPTVLFHPPCHRPQVAGDHVLLPLRIGEEVALSGTLHLRVLRGAAEVWGSRLSNESRTAGRRQRGERWWWMVVRISETANQWVDWSSSLWS